MIVKTRQYRDGQLLKEWEEDIPSTQLWRHDTYHSRASEGHNDSFIDFYPNFVQRTRLNWKGDILYIKRRRWNVETGESVRHHVMVLIDRALDRVQYVGLLEDGGRADVKLISGPVDDYCQRFFGVTTWQGRPYLAEVTMITPYEPAD